MSDLQFSLLRESMKHGDSMLPMNVYFDFIEADKKDLLAHWHEETELIFFKSGRGIYKIDDKSYFIRPKTILIIKKNALHSGRAIKNFPCSCEVIVFNLSMLKSESMDSCQVKYIYPIINNEIEFPVVIKEHEIIHSKLLGMMKKIICLRTKEDWGFELEIKSVLFQIFALLFKYNYTLKSNGNIDKDQEKIKKAIRYIQENFYKPISINEISKMIGFSEHYFCRFFKKRTGLTCVEYINTYRINQAVRLLLECDKPIIEIAFEVGFEDLSYFIRVFKRVKQISPLKFRKEFK